MTLNLIDPPIYGQLIQAALNALGLLQQRAAAATVMRGLKLAVKFAGLQTGANPVRRLCPGQATPLLCTVNGSTLQKRASRR